MAETSKFYTGTTVGDATAAPYSGIAWGLGVLGNYVIPTYLNELEVYAVSASQDTVRVPSGACACNGQLYINDSIVFITPTNAANNRIDRVVIRSDGTNDARVTYVEGTEAAVPSKPTILATDTPLAWVWIPAGFNAVVDGVHPEDVHDERIFKPHGPTSYNSALVDLMFNGEFIGVSGVLGGDAPEGWYLVNTPTLTAAAKIGTQIRGHSIRVQGDAGEGMVMKMRVAPGMYTFRGVLDVDVGQATIDIDGVTTLEFNVNDANLHEYIIRYETTAEEIELTITASAAGSDFKIGQIAVTPGYVAPYLQPKQELILFDYPLADANYTALVTTTQADGIDLSTDFDALFDGIHVYGVIVRMNIEGDASSGGQDYVYLKTIAANDPISIVRADYVPNGSVREGIGYVATSVVSTDPQFVLGWESNGASNLTITAEIIGVIT